MNAGQPVPPDSLFPPMPMSKTSAGCQTGERMENPRLFLGFRKNSG